MKSQPWRHAGFTLIEAIMVIVITGIVAGMVSVFIRSAVVGYVESVARAELTDAADAALRRLARDVRLALPNSLRVTTSGGNVYIEFILTRSGGRYRDSSDGSTGGDFLSFTSAADTSFDVLGKTSNAATDNDYIKDSGSPDYIVVYNLGPGYAPADAYTGGNRAQVQVGGVNCTAAPCKVNLASNPFATQNPPLPSPSSRFQVVPGDKRAISYVCPLTVAGDLQRYENYGFNASQTTSFGAVTPAVVAGRATCSVEYTANATGRNGLLYIQLTLRNSDGTESVQLFQEIHVDNAP